MSLRVSINCITYNHENYIKEALDSFLMQKVDFDYEILIHDDASTDRTVEIIREYQKKYPNIIKPILQKKNQQSQGVKKISYRFNHTRAEGKYIAICEGDDFWTDPNKLQKQVDYMELNEKCTMCFHAANIINNENIVKGTIRPYSEDTVCNTEDLIIGGGGFCSTQSIVYRKEAFDDAPEFYFEAPVGDYPLQIITASKGYAYYIDDNMSTYRKIMSGGSGWSNINKSAEANIKINYQLNSMLDCFNEYTKCKYENAVSLAKLKNSFYILVYQRKIRELNRGKYKKVFLSLSLAEKILIYLRCCSPRLYMKALEMKYR